MNGQFVQSPKDLGGLSLLLTRQCSLTSHYFLMGTQQSFKWGGLARRSDSLLPCRQRPFDLPRQVGKRKIEGPPLAG